MNLSFGVPALAGPDRLKAELQTRCPVGSWPQLTSKLWRCSLPMNRPTPYPSLEGNRTTAVADFAPFLGGAGGGFMAPMPTQSGWKLPMNRIVPPASCRQFWERSADEPSAAHCGAAIQLLWEPVSE